jgi:hypothetical protein
LFKNLTKPRIPGMPLEAIKEDDPDYCLQIGEIGPLFVRLSSNQTHIGVRANRSDAGFPW